MNEMFLKDLYKYGLSFRTNRKLLVIESDDWGSIRMPSIEVRKELLRNSLIHENDRYSKFDSIASEEDLNHLFEVLSKFRDRSGRSPAITANTILTNPDFRKIIDNDFQQYHYELFTETLSRSETCRRSMDTWHQGIDEKLLLPQLHGLQHLNVALWMDGLRRNVKGLRKAARLGTFAISYDGEHTQRSNYMASLEYHDEESKLEVLNSLDLAGTIFNQIFKYNSDSFIAPCYTWNDQIERQLGGLGIKYLQGISVQKMNVIRNGKVFYKRRYHRIGSKNKLGQYYVVRNSFFEPTQSKQYNSDNCLKSIENAFRWGVPAVIGSHRLNYIGSLDQSNRISTLKELDSLLRKVLKKWPNVEFLTTPELGSIISKQKKVG